MYRDDNIDFEKLRKDMENDSMGAFIGGGFGGAFIEASEISRASEEELLKIAELKGVRLSNYRRR